MRARRRASRPSASEMRRPAAVEQREHRGVARENPWLALLAGAQIGVGHRAWRPRSASGFGSVLAIFGARTAASAPTLPLPLRSRKRANDAHARQHAHQRAAADAVGAPRRHEGAHVLRRQRGKLRERRRGRRDARPGSPGTAARRARRPPRVFGDIRRSAPRWRSQRTISAATFGATDSRS